MRCLTVLALAHLALVSTSAAGQSKSAELRELMDRLETSKTAAYELSDLVAELGELEDGGRPLTEDDVRVWVEASSLLASLATCPRRDHVSCLEAAARAAAYLRDPLRTCYWACAVSDACIATGRLEDALDACDRALPFVGRERRLGPAVLASRADVLRRLARFSEAADDIERAWNQLETADPYHKEVRVQLLGLRGRVDLDLGRPYRAALAFDEQATTLTALDPDEHDPVALHQLDFLATSHALDLDLMLERFRLAERRASRLIDRNPLVRSGPLNAQVRVQLGLAQSESAREREDRAAFEEARRSLRAGLAEAPATFVLTARNALTDLALRDRDWEGARVELEAAAEVLGQIDSTREAALWESHASRLALGTGAGTPELRRRLLSLDRAWQASLSSWLSVPRSVDGIGFLHLGSQRLVLSERIRLLLALDESASGCARALSVLIEAHGIGTLARTLGVGQVGLSDVRGELLSDDSGALVWFPAQDRTHLFLVDREVVQHEELESRDVLLRHVRTFQELLTTPPAGGEASRKRAAALERAEEALGLALIPEAVRDRLRRWRRVHLVGLELLREPAVEAVSIDGVELGLSHAVVRTPSLPLSVGLARRPADPLERVVLIGPPTLGQQALDLAPRAARIELERGPIDVLRRALKRLGAGEASGRSATLEELRRRSADAGLLAIVAHGAFLDDSGGRPALLLAPTSEHDGLVAREELEGIEAPSRVVLLACGSARGPERLGDDGVASLIGALEIAGARTVVASREDLPRDATYLLAGALFTHMAEGHDVAESLRRARLEVSRDKDFRDPYFWALLQVAGTGE